MNISLKINYLQLTAKASFSFFKFNPRLKPGAINPHYSRASAINLLFNRTLLVPKLKSEISLKNPEGQYVGRSSREPYDAKMEGAG
jgi:hypothetical protein